MRKKNVSTEFIKTCYSKALIELLKDKPYFDISVTDICNKAGFGRTSYYRYFNNNKDDLILYIAHLRWEEYKEKQTEEIRKDEGKMLLNHVYNHKDFFLLLAQQKLDHIIYKIFHNEFGRKENEDELYSYGKAFFAGAYFGITYEWILQVCIDTPDEISAKFAQGIFLAIEKAKKDEELAKPDEL